jgi:molybdate transport system substrate-binding protein
MPGTIVLFAAWLAFNLSSAHLSAAQEQRIVLFGAASTKNAIDDVSAAFHRKTGSKVVASFAASSALAKQIETGAPADVFVSADPAWMDYLSQRKLVRDSTRSNLLGNRLVVIAPKDAPMEAVTIVKNFDLAALAGDGRIVIGDVRAVPAGRYAKAALEHLGIWPSVEKKLAMTENVRAALALVSRAEAPLGIVYETDMKSDPGVKIVGIFPSDSHPPIVFPAALTATAKPLAESFLAFLRSPEAQSIFEGHGFTFLPIPPRS